MELFKAHVTVEARKGKYLTDMGEIKRKTEASTKKMQSSWNRIGKSITDNSAKIRKMGIAVGAAGALITATLTKIVHSATKLGDELDKMSLRTGESVEQLSALSFAAQISGSSIQEMENGIRRLSRNMNDFQNGIGEAARAFEKLDVSVLDSSGNLRSASSFIIEVADKFNELTSSSEQAAVAQEIFGRGGTAMLPLLKQGSAGIKELTDRAAELGLVISTEAAAAAAEFNDRLTEMKESLKVASAQLGFMLMPILQPFVEDLTEIVGQVARWTEANQGATRAILAFSFELGGALTAIGALLIILPSLVAGVAAIGGAAVLGPIAAFVVAFAGLVAIVIAAKEKATALKREVDALTKSAKAFTQVQFAEGVEDAVEAFGDLAEKITEVRSELDRLQPQMAMLGAGGLERIRELEEALARLSAAQARLITPFVADPGITNQIEELKILTESLREASKATSFLRGEPAPHTRLPLVREQLIPVPTVSPFREFWNKIKRLAEFAAREANQRLLEIDANRLQETIERNQTAFNEMKERAIQAKLDQTEEELAITGAYSDLIYDIAKKNEKRIAKFRRDISKSVINDILDADRERRDKDLEESVAHAEQVAEIWDNVAETMRASLEGMFTDVLSGQLQTWQDFFTAVGNIFKREMAKMAASRIANFMRGLLPGAEGKAGVVELDLAASKLSLATTALVPASASLASAAASLTTAATLIATAGVVGGGPVYIPVPTVTVSSGSGGGSGDSSAPARQIGKASNVGMTTNHFHTTIQITEFDMDTMSQAKVNAWMDTKGYNALKNMASKGKINTSMVG